MINMLFECLSGGRSVFPLCCHGLYSQKELRVHIYLQFETRETFYRNTNNKNSMKALTNNRNIL